jgi:hypothetical protein
MASSNDASNSTGAATYEYAYGHGTVMVLAWMVFAPTGILIARYGRLLHIGARRKLLGDTICTDDLAWFLSHSGSSPKHLGRCQF